MAGVELEEVVRALAPRLFAYALGRTGCRGTAEDIAQDALVALVRRWRQTGPPQSADAFVFAVAKRRAGRAILRRALTAPLETLRGVARNDPAVDRAYDDRIDLIAVI